MTRLVRKVILFALCALMLSLCATALADGHAHLTVVAANYPLYELALNIFAGHVDIMCLNEAGALDYAPDAADMNAVLSCELVIALGDEEWIAALPDTITVFAALDHVELLDVNGAVYDSSLDTAIDPCVWTAPINQALLGYAIADTLTVLDPSHTDFFYANAEAYLTGILELDVQLRATLANAAGKAIRAADGCSMAYFAREYRLAYDPNAAIALDSVFAYGEATYAERLIANAEKIK